MEITSHSVVKTRKICYNFIGILIPINYRRENLKMLVNIIISLVIGGVCGWLAGIIMKSANGVLINIILGIVGGVIGGAIFNFLGINFNGIVGSIICGVVGACLLIFIVRLIKKK